jgi:hypothetical protein
MGSRESGDSLSRGIPLVISALSLLLVLIATSKLAWKAVYQGNLDSFSPKIFIMVIGFSFAATIGVLGKRGFSPPTISLIAKFYTFLYLVLACFTYFGVSLALSKGSYSAEMFISYIFIIVSELIAVRILQSQISSFDPRYLSLPLMSVNLFQLVLLICKNVFTDYTLSILHLAGELGLFIGMSVISIEFYSRYNYSFVKEIMRINKIIGKN